MELINFDPKKTLAELEKDSKKSSIVSRAHKLRQKPVKDLSTEELRLMIAQNSSLKHLVPWAISCLHVDALLKGDGYEGDLLNAVLTVEKKFWMDDLKGYIPMLTAVVETALASANANPVKYKEFLKNSNGAINIFKVNVGLI